MSISVFGSEEFDVIDLTNTIYSGMPVWPGHSQLVVEDLKLLTVDGYAVKKISMNTHIGTHIDTEAHMVENGRTLDRYPIETYFGRTLVVDVSSTPAGKPIPLDTVRKHLEQKKGSEILLLHTGHSLRRGNNSRYLFEWPYVDLDLAQYLSTKGLKAVGTDGLSIAGWGGSVPGHGPITSTAREVHQTLLRMGTIIIEELTNLDKLLQGKEFADVYTIFLPLRIDGSDGSPVRAVALKRRD